MKKLLGGGMDKGDGQGGQQPTVWIAFPSSPAQTKHL